MKHFVYTRSKAFVKVKFSIWAPIKFLYVCLKNKELLIPGVTCEKNCSVWGKICFCKQPVPEMRCQINYFQLYAKEPVSINYFLPYPVEVEGWRSMIQAASITVHC